MSLYLGKKDDERLELDPNWLTTHASIVGMTGSGKTGLGIVLIEELLRSNIPVIVLDPKGDMPNLALRFPNFTIEEFSPWSTTPEKTASLWKDGLSRDGLADELSNYSHNTQIELFTPGSTLGRPINILGEPKAPDIDWDGPEADAARQEINAFVAGLLTLMDIDSDPVTGREHVFLANLIENLWKRASPVTVESLVQGVLAPPMRKLGVLPLEQFYPDKDRTALVMKLNALLANPSFQSWITGDAIDIDKMLVTSGKPKATVFSLAHLEESERHFFISLLLGRLIRWMYSQPGSDKLRAAVYIDEVAGMVPPSKMPPTKPPILRLLKQARAFGLGTILSTQNPVDLDYKALSNTGTWFVGRLQTERDQARLMEGLDAVGGDVSKAELSQTISSLEKREFLLHSTKQKAPRTFSTRWAMSYLAGPITIAQIRSLIEKTSELTPRPPGEPAPTKAKAPRHDETTTAPQIADGVPVRFADPASPWLGERPFDSGGHRLEPAIAATVKMLFDETKADLAHDETWEVILYPLSETFNADELRKVDYDERDFRTECHLQAPTFALPTVPLEKKTYFSSLTKDIKDYIYQERELVLFRNRSLKLYSRPDETRDDFEKRCDDVAQSHEDKAADKLREKLEARIESAIRKQQSAEERVLSAKEAVSAYKQEETVAGVGSVIGVLLGGRMSARDIAKRTARKARGAASRRAKVRRNQRRVEELEAKVVAAAEKVVDLESELEQELLDIDLEWAEKSTDIEEFPIRLEKSDIAVSPLKLIWVPVSGD